MSTISAGTTSTTTLIHSGDTTGSLVLKTNDTGSGGTTAVTIGTDQSFNFSATGQRITGDFSNATIANRVMFQTSTVNGTTSIATLPNGTNITSSVLAFGGSDPANAPFTGFNNTATESQILASKTGTGTYLPMTFYTGGGEKMRIDTSGNVGIGTSSPTGFGNVNLNLNSSGDTMIHMTNTTSGTASGDGFDILLTGLNAQLINREAGYVSVFTSATERMRIDSSGNLLVGGTGVIYYSKTLSQFDGSSKYGYTANDTSGVANVGFVAFAVNGTTTTGAIGTITRNGSSNAVLYNTTSDQRLKENIADADAALGVVGAIKVRKYDWKEGGQHENFGFVAQELAQVVNNVVSKGRTEEDMWSLDYGKLTPLLVKAIQEQQALIQQLQADVAALKGTP